MPCRLLITHHFTLIIIRQPYLFIVLRNNYGYKDVPLTKMEELIMQPREKDITLCGKLRLSVWRNPFLTKKEHSERLGVPLSSLTKHWQVLKQERIEELDVLENSEDGKV